MEFDFTGKKILVTGAGRGIGRATAIALAKAGCKVYALSRTKETLDTLVEEYPDIVPITQDLMNWEETKNALEQLETLDGLLNNAGVAPYIDKATDLSEDQLEYYIRNNLFSAINCMQVVAKQMIASGTPGSIVNVTSTIGMLAFPNFLGYGISKAGLDFATKQFALELGPHNIRVNSVNPGYVKTDLAAKVSADMGSGTSLIQLCSERASMGRVLDIHEVVSPILYLLSSASSMVTGTLHIVDGGKTCNITTKQ